jgi:hypothetical protein
MLFVRKGHWRHLESKYLELLARDMKEGERLLPAYPIACLEFVSDALDGYT